MCDMLLIDFTGMLLVFQCYIHAVKNTWLRPHVLWGLGLINLLNKCNLGFGIKPCYTVVHMTCLKSSIVPIVGVITRPRKLHLENVEKMTKNV